MDVKPGLGNTLLRWVSRKLFALDQRVEAQKDDVFCLREEVRGSKAATEEHVNRVNQQAIAVLHQTRDESQHLHSMLTRRVHDSEAKLNKEISLLRAEVNEVRGTLAIYFQSTSADMVNSGLPIQTEPISIVLPNSPVGDLLGAIQGMFVASPPAANAEAAPPENTRKAVNKSARENCPRCGRNLSRKYLPTHIREFCPAREVMI